MKQSLYINSLYPGFLEHGRLLPPGRGDYTQVTSMQPVGHGQGEFAKEKVVVRSGPWDDPRLPKICDWWSNGHAKVDVQKSVLCGVITTFGCFFFWGWLIETLQKTGESMSQCYFWSFSGSKPRIFHHFFRERSTICSADARIPSDSQVFDWGSFVCCRCASWSWLYWGSCSSTWHFGWRMLKIWETFDVIFSDS